MWIYVAHNHNTSNAKWRLANPSLHKERPLKLIRVYYMGWILAPAGEYDWTVHVQRRCGLMSNYLTTCLVLNLKVARAILDLRASLKPWTQSKLSDLTGSMLLTYWAQPLVGLDTVYGLQLTAGPGHWHTTVVVCHMYVEYNIVSLPCIYCNFNMKCNVKWSWKYCRKWRNTSY